MVSEENPTYFAVADSRMVIGSGSGLPSMMESTLKLAFGALEYGSPRKIGSDDARTKSRKNASRGQSVSL